MREGIQTPAQKMSKIPQKNNSRRGEVYSSSFAFLKFSWKPMSNRLPTSPGVQPPVNRQVYSRAVLRGMPNICFIKPADFPPSPPLRALRKGVSQPPVHIQHSRGERRAQGVMYWRNVVPRSSHSVERECEEFAFAHTGYYCTCV